MNKQSIELAFEKFSSMLVAQHYSSEEIFLYFSNYLLPILKEETEKNRDYIYEDLLDYNYVLEYLNYKPDDPILILAQIIHYMLHLYNLKTNTNG